MTKKSATSSTRKKSSGKRKSASQKKAPVRRTVAAVVFLLLAVFSGLGYITSDGLFVNFFCGFIRGLVGNGFGFVPPFLLICALILFFHHGRPVLFRTLCAFFIPSACGALMQLFAGSQCEMSIGIFKSLWLDGTAGTGGGAFAGFFAELFRMLLSKTGAAIVIIILLALMALAVAWRPARAIISRYNQRVQYVPEPEPEFVPRPKKEPKPAQTQPTGAEHTKTSDFDIPVDEPRSPREDSGRRSFFNKKPAVMTPEEAVTGKRAAPEPEASDKEEKSPEKLPEKTEEKPQEIPHVQPVKPEPVHESALPAAAEKVPEPTHEKPAPAPVPITVEKAEPPKEEKAQDVFTPPVESAHISDYVFPPLTLLSAGTAGKKGGSSDETETNRQRLEAALKSFGINSAVSNITCGPTVTRYEISLEAGVKLSRLTGLSDDIALSLGVSGVRIAAIPNKISTVGIEVPNKTISSVYLRDIIDSPEFKKAESKLTFAIGKNISGDAIVGNISKLPHMLVAGTTGSGKSVCLNSLILSILYKAAPDEVKFILIDPKMVEFKVYNGIPHLLVPVVTEAKKAAGALQWAVTEMMKRYRLFSESGARDIASYNDYGAEADEEGFIRMPHIVVVIDELADLMMVASKEVEEAICRVAQMGRAAGVHLVIATQSPRADVITGLMKANIPSRIALKVSSSLESRIILDAGGAADKLVGNGDMLYAPIGTSKPLRIQGTWVSDEERENIIKFVKNSGEAEYAEDVIAQIDRAAEGKNAAKQDNSAEEPKNDYDELLPQAADVVFEMGQASVSMLQRRLKLGYSRAARIVDQMEEVGIVGPFEGSKPRQILITKEQWQEMQFIQGTAPTEAPIQAVEPVKTAPDVPEQNLFSADDLFNDTN